jgi:hypothetical protein
VVVWLTAPRSRVAKTALMLTPGGLSLRGTF